MYDNPKTTKQHFMRTTKQHFRKTTSAKLDITWTFLITFSMLNIILKIKWRLLNDELTSPVVLCENEQWTKWTSNYATSRSNSKQLHLFTSNTNHSPSLNSSSKESIKSKLQHSITTLQDKKMMQSKSCNNHLQMAATPQQQPNDRLKLQHTRWNQI